MENGFNPGELLNLYAEALRAHAGAGARGIGDVDGVDAVFGQQARAFNFFGAIDAARGNNFNKGDELAVGDEVADFGTLGKWRGRSFCAERGLNVGGGDAGLRVECAQGRVHGADVVGGGSATAADDLHACLESFAGEGGHVLGRTEVDVAAFNCARHSGVGHGGKWKLRCGAHGFNGGENGGWTGGAVDADDVSAPGGEKCSGLLGRCAVKAVAFVVDGDHYNDGQIGSMFACGDESLLGLVERRHGLDDEQIGSSIGKGFDLLGKCFAGFVESGFAEGFKTHSERTNGAGDPGVHSLLLEEMGDGFTCDSDTGLVDGGDFVSQSMAGETKTIGAKGVGFKNLGSGLEVLFVNREDHGGVGEIELVVATIDEDTTGIEDGAHGAVGEYGSKGKGFKKLAHAEAMLEHFQPVVSCDADGAVEYSADRGSSLLYFGSLGVIVGGFTGAVHFAQQKLTGKHSFMP